MQRTLTTGVLAAALIAPAAALGETSSELDALRAEMAAMQAELSQLKGGHSSQATADLKAATEAALRDAEARINYQSDELSAGHDGKFFLASPEGDFRLNIGGQLQFRYIANFRQDSGADDNTSGVGLRRTKVAFNGHVTQDKKFTYEAVFAANDADGDFFIEDFKIGYKLTDDLKATIGQYKLPFAIEELISSKRQLGADRSIVTEFFTLDRSQGIQLDYTGIDDLKLRGTISDGFDNANDDFADGAGDNADLTLTARADYTVFSEGGKTGRDVVAWSGTKALHLGAAGSLSFGNAGVDSFEQYTWTIDGIYKADNFSFIAAFFGLHIDDDVAGSTNDFGLNLGAGYVFDDTIQPFVRYNYVDFDSEGDFNAIEVGVNYFVKKHKAKFTLDALILLDPLNPPGRFANDPGTGLGLIDDAAGEDGQFVLRGQVQLLF